MKKLKIGFDAKRLFYNKEGLGSYARTLVFNLQKFYPEIEYHLFTPSIEKNGLADAFIDNPRFIIHTAGKKKQSLWRSKGIVKDLIEADIDIYWGLSNELPWGIEKTSIKTFVTIHDLIYKKFKKQFSFVDRLIYDQKFSHAIKVSDKILVPSLSTKNDIQELFDTANNKIQVIYQSVNPIFNQLATLNKTEEYLIFVGTLNERKNLMLLVKAIESLPEEERLLVKVVGEGSGYKERVLTYIKKHGLERYFDFRGNILIQDLAKLYLGATALVFPSKYEGFGIPVIEALTLGKTVIVSDSSSLPEIAGQHGIVIDYNDHVDLSKAIKYISKKKNRIALMKDCEYHLTKFQPSKICKKIYNVISNA